MSVKNKRTTETTQILKETDSVEFEQLEQQPLTANDIDWLQAIAHRPIDETELDELNALIEQGSERIRYINDEQEVHRVIEARQRFFEEKLGWGDETHPFYPAWNAHNNDNPDYPAYSMLPKNIVASARTFEKLGYGVEMLQDLGLLRRNPDAIIARDELLKSFGMNTEGIIRYGNAGGLFSMSADKLTTRHDNLLQNGLTSAAIARYPLLLGYPSETITQRANHAVEIGFTQSKFNNSTALLTYPSETLDKKISDAEQLGVTKKLITRFPFLLNHSTTSLEEKIEALRELGIKDSIFLESMPILGGSVESIKEKIDAFAEMGIGIDDINKSKSLLTYDPEGIEDKLKITDKLLSLGNTSLQAIDIFKKSPNAAATTSKRKILTMARIFAEHGNDETLPVDIVRSMTASVDTMMALAANDMPITSYALQKESAAVPQEDRRTKALGLISANLTSGKYSEKTIRSYFMYKPLQHAELSVFPYLEPYKNVGQKKK